MDNFSIEELIILRNSPLFSNLSEENINKLLTISYRTSFQKDEILLTEGEHSDKFFIIISGSVALYKNDESKLHPELIGSLSTSESFGEMRVIQNRVCSLTVKAAEKTEVLWISISELHSPQNQQCYKSIVDSIVAIINDRLYKSNNFLLNKIKEKRKKVKQLIFTLFICGVFALLICELGLALYYVLNTADFCSHFNAFPAENPHI